MMKPQAIDCGSKCKWCDGYGIMTLMPQGWEAPCLECSPTKNLNDLYRIRNKAILAFEKVNELKSIDEHNKRMAQS